MAQEWYAQWEVTTSADRLIKKEGKVSDPARHFGEFLKRFYPTAVKIEYWETDDRFQNPGPHRVVEFNEDGTVKSRTPDEDAAHVGGRGWQADPENPAHTEPGTSRQGVDPRKTRDAGWHPTQHESDEGEPISDKLKRILPEGGLPQPSLTPVGKSPEADEPSQATVPTP